MVVSLIFVIVITFLSLLLNIALILLLSDYAREHKNLLMKINNNMSIQSKEKPVEERKETEEKDKEEEDPFDKQKHPFDILNDLLEGRIDIDDEIK